MDREGAVREERAVDDTIFDVEWGPGKE